MFELLLSSDFDFKKDVPPWLTEHYMLFVVPAFIYSVVVQFHQQQYSYQLIKLLFLWNAGLCAYSAISVYYLTPPLAAKLYYEGYHETVCLTDKQNSFYHQPYGKVIFVFLLSKIVEFGDTAFLILRGKEVGFLHWYHHLATLFATFVQCLMMREVLEWAVWMNVVVHTFMYGYYALSTFYRMKGNRILTGMQCVQMLHGTYITVYSAVFCNNEIDYLAFTLYGIYAWLFIRFYREKYKYIRHKHH